MTDTSWDYSAVPVATFSWEIPASGEQAFTYARVNAGGILWTGETTNPNFGGGHTVGTQSFEDFLANGPLAGSGVDAAQTTPLREHIERHRRPGTSRDPNPVDAQGYTPLHHAAAAGDLDAVARLLREGADVAVASTDNARTPLHRACDRLRLAVVEALLAAGADPAALDAFGAAPLDHAIEAFTTDPAAPRVAIVTALLAAGAPARVRSLTLAAGRGDAAIVKLLLAHGADPRAVDRNGNTALLAGAHDAAVVHALLAAGADARASNRGYTTLHAAVDGASLESVKLLVAAGADPNAPDSLGVTPLARARAVRRADLEAAMRGAG